MSFNLTILGCNSAMPTLQRFSTAQVLNVHERFFLIDCGEGTQIQLRRNKIQISKINHIFISHIHGDHYFGIFGLLSTMHMLDRKAPLHIYSHPYLHAILEAQMRYSEPFTYQVEFHSLNLKEKELLYEDNVITVESFPLKHRVPVCGFLFKEKQKPNTIIKDAIAKYKIPLESIKDIKNGADFTTEDGEIIPNALLTLAPIKPRSYAFCTDTLYQERIVPFIQNVDLLYHEATYTDQHAQLAKKTYHCTARQAAKIAKLAEVGKLLIGHYSSRYKDTKELVEEARQEFPNTEATEDNSNYSIEFKRQK